MDVDKSIKIYGLSADNFDTSPIEAIDMLYRRSQLEKIKDHLTGSQKKMLQEADQILLKNAKKMYEHIGQLYNFKEGHTKRPLSEWWWHLDKIAKSEIVVDLIGNNVMIMESKTEPIYQTFEFESEDDLFNLLQLIKEKDIRAKARATLPRALGGMGISLNRDAQRRRKVKNTSH